MRSVCLLFVWAACHLVGGIDNKNPIYNNPEYTEFGQKLYFGDVLLSAEQEIQMKSNKLSMQTNLWPEKDGIPTIPYYIMHTDPKVSALIEAAVDQYHEKTCIRWVKVPELDPGHKIRFYQGNGCWSFIGKHVLFYPAQNISIGPGCEYFHTLVHEMGHASGMFHTQQGNDRDRYVVINFDNVEPGKESNFQTATNAVELPIPYNYYSVMHYGYWAFSLDGTPTITAKNVDAQYLMGNNEEGLVFTDAKAINTAYKCIDKWESTCGPKECFNGGYTGSNCKCVCPPNFDGENCEYITGREYPLNPVCGGNVTYPTNIVSPDLGSQAHDRDCSWWIQPPKGMLPKLTITYTNLFGTCWTNIVTIRDKDLYQGTSYCTNEELPKGKSFVGTEEGLIVHFVSRYDSYSCGYVGFSAEVSFIEK